ncbi:MAG TPA: ABC transporter permease [Longimicrobiaceae bacterium]|nr:ABC transporter permease [Longimicrobiaceae bacterium]
MDSLLQDLRYAFRALRRSPGFALVAVLTLALGIGVNTAVFSAANALVLRPADAHQPGRIARIHRNRHSPLSWREFRHVRDHNRAFSAVWAERSATLALNTPQGNEKVSAALVSGTYFTTLGVPAAHGRVFTPAEDSIAGASPVVVLSHRYWQARFAADPGVVGRTLRLNGRTYTVVGVARAGFRGAFPGYAPQLWLPLSETQPLAGVPLDDFGGSVYVAGRLRPDVSLRQAGSDVGVLAAQLTALDPAREQPLRLRVDHSRGINAEQRGMVAGLAGALLLVTLLVLAIACTNVANLLLARGAARRREIGIRMALGAGRGRLVRQLLTESVLLALAGGVLAVLATAWAASLAASLVPADFPGAARLEPDGRVLAFALGASLLASALFGVAPALRAASPRLVPALRDEASAVHRSRLRRALVGGQVALCMVLLAVAALFLRSLANARAVDPGFDPAPILNLGVDLGLGRYDERTGPEYYRRLLEAARALPGVEGASLQHVVPLTGTNMESSFLMEGDGPGAERRRTNFNVVGADFFRVTGVPVLRGREFGAADRPGTPEPAVVNETFARRWFPGGDAVGRRITLDQAGGPYATIVGVVRDAKYVSLGEDPRPMLYLSFSHNYRDAMTLHLRARGGPVALADPLLAAARALDPALPLPRPRTMPEELRFALLPSRVAAAVLGGFGALALLLAAVGIYGVVSYGVGQRTREIGIRAALGAGRGAVVRLVLGESLRTVAVGGAVGIALALLAGVVVRGLLYGVSPADPAVLLGTPLLLGAVALLASWLPARRAARVDPMIALRAE